MRLLLVEDDARLSGDLLPLLGKEGYACEVAANGNDGHFLGMQENFDLVILDLGLPGKNGLEVLREWRAAGRDMPVLILTARDAWHERVDGLKAGADDYLGKPFHPQELIARLQALARRNSGHASNQLSWNGLTLDIEAQRLHNGTDWQQLTGIEFRLLRYLMSHPGKICSKTELSEQAYREDQLKDSNVIEVYINHLRKRIGKERIITLRNQGYRLQESAP
jgi:two-component system, OmpR family, response regulator